MTLEQLYKFDASPVELFTPQLLRRSNEYSTKRCTHREFQGVPIRGPLRRRRTIDRSSKRRVFHTSRLIYGSLTSTHASFGTYFQISGIIDAADSLSADSLISSQRRYSFPPRTPVITSTTSKSGSRFTRLPRISLCPAINSWASRRRSLLRSHLSDSPARGTAW